MAKKAEPVVAPPFEVGDELTTVFKSLTYYINEPIKVISARNAGKQCASGWMITVDTTAGHKELDSFHFKKVTPGELPI